MAGQVGEGRGAIETRPGPFALFGGVLRGAGRPPPVLYALCAVEALWAFGFFAVQTTLTLSMTSKEADVSGAAAWRVLASHVAGQPLSATAAAALAYGLFSAAAYALPLPGGLIGDRVGAGRGRHAMIALGLALLSTGLAAFALPGGFVPGLFAVAAGTGLVKGNLIALIGSVCAQAGVPRSQGFGLYLIAANVGALCAPLLCGTIGETIGWRPAYAATAAASLLGPLIYAFAWPRLAVPADAPRMARTPPADGQRGSLLARVVPLVAPLAAEVLFFGAYNQAFSLFPVWAQTHVQRSVGGWRMPVTWFGVVDGGFTIAATAVALRLWRRGAGGSPARRVTVGAALAAAAFLLLAAVGEGRAGLPVALVFFLLLDAAIPWVDTTALARLNAAAPAGWEGAVGGLYFLSAAAASLLTGALGSLYDPGAIRLFWGAHVLVAAATALAALGLRGAVARPDRKAPPDARAV